MLASRAAEFRDRMAAGKVTWYEEGLEAGVVRLAARYALPRQDGTGMGLISWRAPSGDAREPS